MAFLIVIGILTTVLARASGFFSGGEELIPGMAVLVGIVGVKHLIEKKKPT